VQANVPVCRSFVRPWESGTTAGEVGRVVSESRTGGGRPRCLCRQVGFSQQTAAGLPTQIDDEPISLGIVAAALAVLAVLLFRTEVLPRLVPPVEFLHDDKAETIAARRPG